MADVTQLGYPAGFLGLDDNQPQSNPNANNLGNIRPTGSNTGFVQTTSKDQGLKDIDANLLAYGQKHGIDTLRGVISRWAPPSENDTKSYIDTVAKRLSLDPDQKIDLNDPAIRHLISTGIILQEKGPQSIYGAKSQSQQVASDSPFALPQDTSEYKPYKATVTKITATQPQQQNANPLDVIGNKPTSPSIFNGLDTFGKNDVANAQKVINSISPEDWQKNSILANVGNVIYQTALGNEKEAKQAFNDLGDKGVGIIKGLYHAVEHAPETITNIVKNPITTGAQVAKGILYDPETLLTSGTPKGVLTEVSEAKPALVPVSPKTDVPTYLRQKFAEKQTTVNPSEVKTSGMAEQTQTPSNIATPYNPQDNFKEHNYTEKGLPPEEVKARMELADRTAPGLKSDPNVFEGRGKDRATDYAISNTDTPRGHLMAEQFAKEKQAQIDYGNKLIDETGGTKGLDESANYKRGSSIIKPLEDLSTEFDNQIKNLYQKRNEQAANVPVIADEVNKVLNTESEVKGHEATVNLAEGAKARLRELGMMDKDGNMLPSTAMQAEQFRQYLNRKWTPQNASLNGMLKNSIDNDVFANANEVIHKDARALVEARKNTLDNPKGIASILDSSGPNGINRKVATERIADTITNMPVDQFDHIIKTLDSVPKSLQESAQLAKSEIKAHFLNKAEEQFAKSANAGTKYLNSNKEVFNRLFSPEELAKINDRNSMAHLYKTDTGYKGAAVQTINLAKRGIGREIFEQAIKKGGAVAAEAAVGGASGGMAGLGAHHTISSMFEKNAAKRELKAQNKAARKKEAGFISLSDMVKKE